jgi:hypothetical protein
MTAKTRENAAQGIPERFQPQLPPPPAVAHARVSLTDVEIDQNRDTWAELKAQFPGLRLAEAREQAKGGGKS